MFTAETSSKGKGRQKSNEVRNASITDVATQSEPAVRLHHH